eukprot:1151007-Pelagomonas_calceolata.AAC.3
MSTEWPTCPWWHHWPQLTSLTVTQDLDPRWTASLVATLTLPQVTYLSLVASLTSTDITDDTDRHPSYLLVPGGSLASTDIADSNPNELPVPGCNTDIN